MTRAAVLVVLRPAGGGDVTARPITAANVHESAPDPQEAEQVRSWFADAGFDVGPLVGVSFSIETTRPLMDEWFPDFAEREGTGAELGLDKLPETVARPVQAVVSEAPPEFGPGAW